MASPVKIWRNQKKIVSLLWKEGKVISYTKVFVPPQGFISQAPYIITVVEMKDGKRIIAQFVEDAGREPRMGEKVITILRKTRESDPQGVIPYGVKVRPLIYEN